MTHKLIKLGSENLNASLQIVRKRSGKREIADELFKICLENAKNTANCLKNLENAKNKQKCWKMTLNCLKYPQIQ